MFQSYSGSIDRERDRLERALITRAIDEGKPVLGICRGMQLINVVMGGTLIQSLDHFYVEVPQARSVLPVKHVAITPGSLLSTVFEREHLWVNALHKQAVSALGEGLRVSARETTGVIQAIESERAWCVGVQWHPEFLPQKMTQQRLFRSLVHAAARGSGELHERA